MKRFTYLGTLRFPYGFHTGDGRRLAAVDQPLFREAGGQVALAGSSLAGVLRADLERLLRAVAGPGACLLQPKCRCVVCRLLGPKARERRGTEGGGLQASKLHVTGGRAGSGAEVRIRDRVGIDRRTRTAADRRKYDVELVDGGAEFPFEIRVDDPEEDERLYLEAVLRRLAGGWLFLGGKTSSGLGRAEVASLDRCELDLAKPADLVQYLLADDATAGATITRLVPPEETGSAAWAEAWELAATGDGGDASDVSWAQVRIHLELSFPWGFLVNDPAEALQSGFDHTFTRRAQDQPVLPGSALRGALRSRAERILRTFGGNAAACDLNRRGQACHEVIEQESRGRGLKFEEEQPRHCWACRVFGSGRLASAVRLTDFLPVEGGEGAPQRQEFVAIDRFTGGAAPGAKFNAEASAGVTFAGELHMEIGPDRLTSWGLGLLALVLRDLLLGDVPVGFGTAKGLNEYTARIIGVDRFWVCPPPPFAGDSLGLDEAPGTRVWRPPADPLLDGPSVVPQLAGKDLQERLIGWVEALHAELAGGREIETDSEREEGAHG